MGLAIYMVEGILREHCHREIHGSVVQIGRQTVELTVPDMIRLFMRFGLSLNIFRDGVVEIDRQTLQARQKTVRFVNDRTFFGALGAAEVHAVDHSDFEGADILHNMNEPIGASLEGIADLVLDGSTLDNVHDPALALMNYNRMLRPGGRVISINAAKPDVQGAYCGTPPEWFLDYYAANEYADCQVYAQLNLPNAKWQFAWDEPQAFLAMDYKWVIENGRAPPLQYDGWAFTIVVAEKGSASTWDRVPTRTGFRNNAEQARWLTALERFSKSKRPSFLTTGQPNLAPPEGFVKATYRAIKTSSGAEQPHSAAGA
jgi:SAM-dependent methyltransferase